MKRWLCLTLLAGTALAHDHATGVVKERMDAMDAIGKANRSLSAIARGRADFDLTTVKNAAKTIAEQSGQSFVDLFPEGSLDDISEAKADIWQDFDRFTAYSMELESSATALSKIATEDQFKEHYNAVSKTCGGCHRAFREKKR